MGGGGRDSACYVLGAGEATEICTIPMYIPMYLVFPPRAGLLWRPRNQLVTASWLRGQEGILLVLR